MRVYNLRFNQTTSNLTWDVESETSFDQVYDFERQWPIPIADELQGTGIVYWAIAV
jgi:hypothetical protein